MRASRKRLHRSNPAAGSCGKRGQRPRLDNQFLQPSSALSPILPTDGLRVIVEVALVVIVPLNGPEAVAVGRAVAGS
jgi:hypothetical protein